MEDFGQSTADEYLTPHNDARAGLNQGIPSLTWDTTLESYATDWAATRAAAGDDCALIHSGGPYGENIYWSSGPSTPADAVQAWVSEEAYYDYATNSCSAIEGESCGHYTQVVWRDTAALGCGSATCPSGALFVVCSYDPPGNVVGQLPY
ncbi:pathogenesis-related protein 1 [Marchantia polymorpha subsp. ruderalis]